MFKGVFTLFELSNVFNLLFLNWIQIGFSYACLLDDSNGTFTGYLLQCKGWISVYLYPKRPCF